MRLSRPRFTVRRMMVAVAILGLVVSVGIFSARRQSFAIMARDYANMETAARLFEKDFPGPFSLYVVRMIDTEKGFVQVKGQKVAYYAQMKEKYERAARFPWLSIGADPPEPPDPEWSSETDEPRQEDRPAVRSDYGLIVMPPKIGNGAP